QRKNGGPGQEPRRTAGENRDWCKGGCDPESPRLCHRFRQLSWTAHRDLPALSNRRQAHSSSPKPPPGRIRTDSSRPGYNDRVGTRGECRFVTRPQDIVETDGYECLATT